MKTILALPLRTLLGIGSFLLLSSCADTDQNKDMAAQGESPMFEVASQEYADLAETTFDLMSEFDLDTWGDYLADDIIWYWPDGNSKTRHTIKGKDNLIAWWRDWKENTGGKLAFSNYTFLPIKVNESSNHYNLVGTGVICYTDLTISLEDQLTSVRQNIVFMFNDDKKISHVLLYYDRTGLIELTNVVLGDPET